MTDKQIKLDGSFIPIEEAIKAGLISEKDINVPSKEIIIDGVDVSRCESFCNGICCKVGFGDDASCKLFSDCNYKQLKRAEQKLEKIKENKYSKALEEIREYLQQFKKKKSNFYTLNDVITDIANNIEKIISECEVEDE